MPVADRRRVRQCCRRPARRRRRRSARSTPQRAREVLLGVARRQKTGQRRHATTLPHRASSGANPGRAASHLLPASGSGRAADLVVHDPEVLQHRAAVLRLDAGLDELLALFARRTASRPPAPDASARCCNSAPTARPNQTADVATRLAALPGSRHVMRTPSEGAGGATLVTADVGGQGAADAALAAVRAWVSTTTTSSSCASTRSGPPRPRTRSATSSGPTSSARRAPTRGCWPSLSRVHGHRWHHRPPVRRRLQQRDPDRRSDGGQPRHPPGHRDLRRASPRPRRARATLVRDLDHRVGAGLRRCGADDRRARACRTSSPTTSPSRPRPSTASTRSMPSTVIVALVAGVAAIHAIETRATFAVGVAISVTTIPASRSSASPPAWARSARRRAPCSSSLSTSSC